MSTLEAVSPIDGRYRKTASTLAPYFSEAALIKYRLIVEGEYLIALSEEKGLHLRKFTPAEKKHIRDLYDVSREQAARVKEFEAVTNHDVKAAEYFMKESLKNTSLKDSLEWVHFALTSEDTNNLSYGLILSESINDVMLPTLGEIQKFLESFAKKHKSVAMLARTHGQSASPTTLGKEFKIFSERLKRQISVLKKHAVLVKINGATGNYNAQVAAYPKHDWEKFSVSFIKRLAESRNIKLEANLYTAQIEPHDTYAELFDCLRRINTILIDFNQDMWRYISDGWIAETPKAGEVGSSTMPHKINPIDFENSEGNLGLANSLFSYFSQKLPISRLQRDLSDSTVERNFGTAFAYSFIAYKSMLRGLQKITVNTEKIKESLSAHQEVVAEAIQTILRREGMPMPYESLKALTRGKTVTRKDFEKFISSLKVPKRVKDELRKITPENYIGLASKLAS